MTARRKQPSPSKRSTARRNSKRSLHHQTLERRQLLAAELGSEPPRLVSLAANSGENFELNENNLLSVAPTELTFRFGGGQELDPSTLQGIRIIPAGGDGSFDADDDPIIPGFLGFADDTNSRIVVARFAETLPDDLYRIEIAGFDDTNEGVVGLRNDEGMLFEPRNPVDADRPVEAIRFEVEVGPRVLAVVPQPIEGVGSARTQARDQIHVYFNEDPLSNPAAGVIDSDSSPLPVVNPEFYRLIFTGDTVENTDDTVTLPDRVEYDPALNRVTLTFADDLSELPAADAAGGSATYRLRIGSGDDLPAPPQLIDGSSDAGDLFSASKSLNVNFQSGIGSVVVTDGVIQSTEDVIPQWPGAGDAIGRRDQRRDEEIVGRIDTNTGINVFQYNFANLYGLDPQGNRLDNAITEAQKQRVREVFDLYSERLGVQFVETQDSGLQIVTGDLRAIVETADTGAGPDTPYSLYRVNEQDPTRGVLVLDAGEPWYDAYGLSPDDRPSYFVEAVRGVGNLLGIGHLFHLPPGVGAGGSSPDEPNSTFFSDFFPDLPVEPEFLSQSDITLGQALHRPESNDVDFYQFSAAVAGRVKIETIAQRLDDSTLLDTHLQLYRIVDASRGEYELIAGNDDFFSTDSYIELEVGAGDYIVGVSAAGNDRYNGEVADSGLGGRSEGGYELVVRYEGEGSDTITDTSGTELDGDADGVAGGNFNYWFRTAREADVAGPGESRLIFVDKQGNDSSAGTLNSPLRTIRAAFDAAQPGDIVRLLPNGGLDGQIQTTADNFAYEIGRGGTNNAVLRDGAEFEVPRGVAVMIDAGAILKLQAAKISVGSESVDEDRSLASLQVLGTPLPTAEDGSPLLQNAGSVFFTSYNDESIAIDTNPLPTSPQPSNWAGIEFRNDFDYSEGRPVWENEGIFLDYASHADMQYGGGSVAPTQPVVNTLTMFESRPTLIYNTITNAAQAAMSADPDSFLETNFNSPIFQRVERFTSDYDRIGPELSGNTLIDNTINGIAIRVRTPAAGQLEPMTVSGRLDDTDIVHTLSQALVVQGQPGGPILLEDRPDVLNVTVVPASGGTLQSDQAYDYRITYVTTEGSESLASLPTTMAVPGPGGAVRLNDLPTAPAQFAGRRLYRLDPATGEYVFVQAIDRGTTSFVDTGESRGGLLPESTAADETFLPRYDARLAIEPGLVMKMLGSRVETTFGGDFYAEARDGRPVIFTSRLDDSYGAGGTFDTNNDRDGNRPQPGDWGGLVFRQDSIASLDHVQVAFAGGASLIEGGAASFNAVEIQQADARIANSLFINNADGFSDTGVRGGRGFNDAAAIFIRGSQSIIVDNTIIENEGAALSINPDALSFHDVFDGGRSTGGIDLFETDQDNQGPLLAANRLDDNGLNGLFVRSELLTTESVWDDTDIVHIVGGEINSMTHHFHGGLRLKSDANQSLVVKFDEGGTLVGSGRPLDIVDRVGGTLQILGQGGFPVILTSLHDDSVGAGFTPGGVAQTDTDETDESPSAGDWTGLQLLSYINDRNVAYVIETERAIEPAIAENALANDGQVVGLLARDEFAGDETARLGFNIRGTIATPADRDVYRFDATGGTEVYIDIDQTSFGLDTVVELIDVNDNVLARSDDSFREITDRSLLLSNLAEDAVQPLYQGGTGQVESPNVLDAGFRVVLPGADNTVNRYYVRVRSASGQSSGQYQLSIRLRETDEVAGSTVQLADIRYANEAILVSGSPLHSPLVGDWNERLQYTVDGEPFDPYATTLVADPNEADAIGNLLTSDRGTLVVTGEIGNAAPDIIGEVRLNDLDIYQVDLFAQQLEPDVFDSENRFVPVTFDVDYADGLGRVNTSISVYNQAGILILHSRDSNVAEDQGRPTLGVDMENLPGGSAGNTDAFIGPVELPEGTYYVVVHNAATIPEPLGQFFLEDPVDLETRLAPINSVRRIAEHTYDELAFRQYTAEAPIIEPLLTDGSVVDYSLDDVTLFVGYSNGIDGTDTSSIASINPFTGSFERLIGDWFQSHRDIAIRDDGELFTYSTSTPFEADVAGNTGNYLNISPVDGSVTQAGDDALTYFRSNDQGNGNQADTSDNGPAAVFRAEAMAYFRDDRSFQRSSIDGGVNNISPVVNTAVFYAVGDRDVIINNDPSIPDNGPGDLTKNILYMMQEATGFASARGRTTGNLDTEYNMTPYRTVFGPMGNRAEFGVVDTGFIFDTGGDGGIITGIDVVPTDTTSLLSVTDRGGVHRFNRNSGRPAPADSPAFGYRQVIPTTYYGQVEVDPLHEQLTGRSSLNFTGMSLGPRNIQGGDFRDVMFATTNDGWLYAFSIDETAQELVKESIFVNGRSAVPISFGASGIRVGLQPTGLAFSHLEAAPWHETNDRRADDGHGNLIPYDNSRLDQVLPNNSLYYGFEIDGDEANNTLERPDTDPLGTLAPGGSHGSVISQPFNLEGYSPADKPTVYFSYFIEVEDDDDYRPGPRQQNDALRVFGAGDDGQWRLLATNDDFRELGSDDEYDEYIQTDIPVQQLFDDSDAWRQARVDISPLAGSENVRLRFDFSTSGSMRKHFGSAELVARPGDEIGDRSTFAIDLIDNLEDPITQPDPVVRTVVFENVVGIDLGMPSGSALNDGDQFRVNGPSGTVTATFREGPLADPGRNEIVFLPTDSPTQVARAAVQALDKELRPYSDGNGQVSLLAASDFQVIGDTPVGRANNVFVDSQFTRLVFPEGDELFAGESFTVFGPGPTTTLTYVRTPTGAPGELVFSASDTAEDLAERALALLPGEFGAFTNEGGTLLFGQNVFISFDASQTNIVVNDPVAVDESRFTVTIPLDPAELDDDDTIDITAVDGTQYTVLLANNEFNFSFGNFLIWGIGGDDPQAIADRLYDLLPAELGAIINDLEVTFLASNAVLNGDSNLNLGQFNFAQDVFQFVGADGVELRHEERITIGIDEDPSDDIKFDGGFVTFTFIEQGRPSTITGNLVTFNDSQTAADLYSQIVSFFGAEYQAYVDPANEGINFANPDVVFDIDDRSTFYFPFGNDNPAHVIDPVYTTTDQFDAEFFAAPIAVPDGEFIEDGETLRLIAKDDLDEQNTTLITFLLDDGNPAGPNEVKFSPTDSAAEIALKLVAVIPARYEAFLSSSREILVRNASQIITANDSNILAFQTEQRGAIAVSIDSTMSSNQVAERLRIALAQGLGAVNTPDGVSQASASQYPLIGGDRIRLYVNQIDPGPYGLHDSGSVLALRSDFFGETASTSFSRAQVKTEGAANNEVEGVYIDDIVVGFAERGEMVLNAPTLNFDFLFNPETLPDSHSQAVQPERQNETLVGGYTLEIHTADPYGVPQDYDPINLELDEDRGLGRTIDTNDRLADGAVTLVTQAGQHLIDGDTFVLSDGTRSLTFEFDDVLNPGVVSGNVPVPFDASESDPQFTAIAVRNAINSPQAQEVLNIFAATGDSRDGGSIPGEKINSGHLVELFGPYVQLNPAGGRFIKMDLVDEETYQGRETSRLFPIVDHDAQTVDYVRLGDQIANAAVSGYVDADTDVLVATGKIGDPVNTGVFAGDSAAVLGTIPTFDYDTVRIHLEAGDTIDIDVDTLGFAKAAEKLELPVITVYGPSGSLSESPLTDVLDRSRQSSLFENSFADGEKDPGAFLEFTAPETGYFDVVVSSATLFGNTSLIIPSFTSAAILEGRQMTIGIGSSQVTYRYTTNPNFNTTDEIILLQAGDSPAQIAAKTRAAIENAQGDVTTVSVDGRFINIFSGDFPVITLNPPFDFGNPIIRPRANDFGAYSLTIRPDADNNDAIPDRDVLIADYHFGVTDVNRVREQGQLIISSNFISHTAGVGIVATSGPRGQGVTSDGSDTTPRPGPARLLRNENQDNLIPGTVISNNVIFDAVGGGILFEGGTQPDDATPAPVPYGRIVNNTVVGNGDGSGIVVSSSASPTLINNVVAGFATGIDVDDSSAAVGTTVEANAYSDNDVDSTIPLSSSAIVIPDGQPIFKDPQADIYIPVAGSDLIDSSFSELSDRGDYFLTVKEPVGIDPSPIIAPGFDAYGQSRVDDPTVDTPGGIGGNVFIDRGAIDRADLIRPVAVLTAPQDAINTMVPGGDGDPDESFVRLTAGTVEFFEIQFLDPNGTGPDIRTITEESVLITENGRTLIPDVDFTFGYSDNSRTIRLTPLAGLWNPDAVYDITLNNQSRIAYEAPNGSEINDGDQVRIVDLQGNRSVFEFDSGYVLNIPTTTSLQIDASNAGFQDRDTFTITSPNGESQRFEIKLAGAPQTGNIAIRLANAGTVTEVRDAILDVLSEPTLAERLEIAPIAVGQEGIQLGVRNGHSVTGDVAGLTIFGQAEAIAEGDQITYTTPEQSATFELTFTEDDLAEGVVPVRLNRTDTPDEIAAKIAAAAALQDIGLESAQAIGGGSVLLGGMMDDQLTVDSVGIQTIGEAGVTGPLTLTVDDDVTGADVDGQTFTITNGNLTETFEFTTDATATSANRLILVGDSAAPRDLASAIADEVAAAFAGDLSPVAEGAVVTLGEQPAVIPVGVQQVRASIDTGTAPLTIGGVAGGAIPVSFLPTADFTPAATAATLIEAIRISPLTVTTFAPGGGTILFGRVASIDGLDADGTVVDIGTTVPAITDLAGNSVASNRDNDETRFTIIMPEVVFDFGDAPENATNFGPTTLANNGARHAITGGPSVRLGTLIDSEPDGQPFPDADDDRLAVNVDQSSNLLTIDMPETGVTALRVTGTPVAGSTVTVTIDEQPSTLQFVTPVDNPSGDNIPVVFNDDDTPQVLAGKIADAIRGRLEAFGGSVILEFDESDDAAVLLRSIDDEDGVSTGTFTTGNGQELTVFAVPGASGELDPSEIVGFLNAADPGGTPVAITVTGTGLLDAWIDFNDDGDFFDAGEQVVMNRPVTTGVNTVTVNVPSDAVFGETWMRLRVSDAGGLGPDGVSIGGEVEDYEVSIRSIEPALPNDDAYTLSEDTVLEVTAAPGLIGNDDRLESQLLPVGSFVVTEPENGTVEIINPFEGTFRYTPNPNFSGVDQFTYRLSTQEPLEGESSEGALLATVTLTVDPVNDPPQFTVTDNFEILETDAGQPVTLVGALRDFAPGPETAEDELAEQTVVLAIDAGQSQVAPGLMTQPATITDEGDLVIYPAPDAFGTATYVVTVSDDDPTDPITSQSTITVIIRPVNDAPGFDTAVAGTSDSLNPDDQYSVASGDADGDGSIDDATITYTLSEDNAADPTADGFFIPLRRDTSAVGYARVGLLDVFNVGADNETDDVPSGLQTLQLNSIDGETALGGTLEPVEQDGQVVGYRYTPPLNFNRNIVAADSFSYEVIDDSPDGGETYSLEEGALVDDRLVSSNRVELVLNPVNDRPQFMTSTLYVEAAEDASRRVLNGFAFDVAAGPPLTAFDEVDIASGQTVEFSVASLDFAPEQSEAFFSEFPSINADGDLTFRPAADVFGEFRFEIVLTDDGPDNSTRGDLISSQPVVLTIDVQPINDPPMVDPNGSPLQFSLPEDGSIIIPVRDEDGSMGLLNRFVVGPANEASDVTPGGNQTLALASPIPVATSQGGTLLAESENGEVVALRYIPRANFTGTDSFIYTVMDDGESVFLGSNNQAEDDPRIASTTVTLQVTPINDPPQFSGGDDVSVIEDAGSVVIDGWANNVQPGPASSEDEVDGTDSAPAQDVQFEFTQISTTNPDLFAVGPAAVIDGRSASLTFRPAQDASGEATFEVRLIDDGPNDPANGDVNFSDTRTFTIRIEEVNDPPQFTAGGPVTVTEDSGIYNQSWATDISPGAPNESDQTVRFRVETPVEVQDLFTVPPRISPSGMLQFTPADDANGVAEVSVFAIDSDGAEAAAVTLRITITPVNDAPEGVRDEIETDEDTLLVLTAADLLANDSDPDTSTNPNETLSVVLPAETFTESGARLVFDAATGEITYDPRDASRLQALAAGETRQDTFNYRVRDAQGAESLPITVNLNVAGRNDAPTVLPDSPSLSVDGQTVVRPLLNDSDIDGTIDPGSIQIASNPSFGSVDVRPNGTIVYTPFAGFDGDDQFAYTVADDQGLRSAVAVVTIGNNTPPVANDDAATTFFEEGVDIDLAANDVDNDNLLILSSVQILNGPNAGQVMVRDDGTVRYIPDAGFTGVDTFRYTIEDEAGNVSEPAEVTVRVLASRLQNPTRSRDVNDDGFVTAIDALLVINRLNRTNNPPTSGPPFYDVDGNREITANDALLVINQLNRRDAANGEGERLPSPGDDESVVVTQDGRSDEPVSTVDLTSDRVVGRRVESAVANDIVDLIAEERSGDAEAEKVAASVDAAMARLL